MRISSINLNKRLGNPAVLAQFESWLENANVDLILAQEPWNRKRENVVILKHFYDLGGNDVVRVWIHKKWVPPKTEILDENWQVVHLDFIELHNVYLSAYSSKERTLFLDNLRDYLLKDINKPIIITGDFNLAPNPEDGMLGDQISKFTKQQERVAFKTLLIKLGLFDSTSTNSKNNNVSFTIERNIRNNICKFRCDLALITDYVLKDVIVSYDHNVRTGKNAFTDHSSILIDFPIDLMCNNNDLFNNSNLASSLQTNWEYNPFKTALHRNIPSSVAKAIMNCEYLNGKISRILDYGCGKGRAINFFNKKGMEIDGWDPHDEFGFNKTPTRLYNLVMCTFVLNVLPNPYERFKVIRDILSYTAPGGFSVITTRSPKPIQNEVIKKGWKKHNDGYWSSITKRTFQKGIDINEIKEFLPRLNAEVSPITYSLPKITDTEVVIIKHKNSCSTSVGEI